MRLEQITMMMEQARIGKLGSDLFIHYMPADANQAVLVVPALSGSRINHELPRYRKDVGFQVIARSPRLDDAQRLSDRIFELLTTSKMRTLPAMPALNIPAVRLSYIRAVHDPQPYPRLLGKGWEVSTNFLTTYVLQEGVA